MELCRNMHHLVSRLSRQFCREGQVALSSQCLRGRYRRPSDRTKQLPVAAQKLSCSVWLVDARIAAVFFRGLQLFLSVLQRRNRQSVKMIPGRLPVPDNPLGLSWHDSAWIPMLNPNNIMDYFSERSNPFYDRTCNNEVVKMQRLNPEQLTTMTGLEYILLHVQEPILYVIRKQHRHSATQATPLADYYIIAGVVYQAPDLASVVNSRLLSAVHHLQSSFEEASACSRYHPSKGYSWDFKNGKTAAAAKKETPVREEPSTLFQRQRVDMLLGELIRKYPLPMPKPAQAAIEPSSQLKQESQSEKKDMKPPPERKPRVN